jgi:hypothetical protein
MTSRKAEDEYYRAVEETFVRRRGAAMLLSPRDWNLIGEWKDAGIPLRVVLQAIDNIFEGFGRRAPTGRRINSLSYCRQEVLALHEVYQGLHAVEAGRPLSAEAAAGVAAAARHLGRLARRVRAAMAGASEAGRDRLVGCLARVAADLKNLRKEIKGGVWDPHLLEQRLRRFDEDLVAASRESLSKSEIDALEGAAELALGRAGDRMTPEAREGTRLTALAALLRQATGIPRLTLFD